MNWIIFMNLETYREFCLSLPGTSESMHIGPDTTVYLGRFGLADSIIAGEVRPNMKLS
ncbi:MAG TPA: hypothetical protein VKZ56_00115 [Membranihabitans sp.]|nr:hypothetical protein [Membranihabitans sp.]